MRKLNPVPINGEENESGGREGKTGEGRVREEVKDGEEGRGKENSVRERLANMCLREK